MNEPVYSLILVIMSAALLSCHVVAIELLVGDNNDQITSVEEPAAKNLETKEQLVATIGKLEHNPNRIGPYVEEVLASLLRMKNRDVQVVAGVTVDELIRQRHFQKFDDCSKASLKKRADILEKIAPEKDELLGIYEYQASNVVISAVVCATSRQKIDPTINDPRWLEELFIVARDSHQSRSSAIRATVNFILGKRSN